MLNSLSITQLTWKSGEFKSGLSVGHKLLIVSDVRAAITDPVLHHFGFLN